VVAKGGLGGFSPDPELKRMLIEMEKRNKRFYRSDDKQDRCEKR